eukprot:360622-Chlamydomonas_euryale.AAC.18
MECKPGNMTLGHLPWNSQNLQWLERTAYTELTATAVAGIPFPATELHGADSTTDEALQVVLYDRGIPT